jgi:hypothetical protein
MMSVTPPPDPNELDLLSAYLDGALPDSEHAALEARLAAEPGLRAALDEMRWTVQLVRATPQLVPPHNFTLDPARFRRRVPWWAGRRIGASLQLVGALGTIASIALIAAGVLFMNAGSFAPAPTVPNTPTSAAPALALQPTQPGTEERRDEETRQAASADRAAAPLTATPTPSAMPRTSVPAAAATAIMAPFALPTAAFATVAPLLPVSPAQPPASAGSDLVRATATAALGFGGQEPGQGDLPRTALAGMIPTATPELAAQSKSAMEKDGTAIARAALATSTPLPTVTATVQDFRSNAPSTATLRPFSAVLPSATLAASQTAQEALTVTPASVGLLQTPRASPAEMTLAAANATPAAAPSGNAVGEGASAPASRVSPLQVVLIVGITLLVVSIMLFGIGWLRARL